MVQASLVSDAVLRCDTPPSGCDAECVQSVEVSLNSESYSSDGVPFTYHTAAVHSLSVVSGPVLGGTVLTVRGEGFVDAARVDTLCKFGRYSVLASFVSATELRCASPSAERAAAAALVSLDFGETGHGHLALHAPEMAALGELSLPGGLLQLTSGDFRQEAAALLSAPVALTDARVFDAAFDVNVGGGFGASGPNMLGESVTFCVGDLSRGTPLSEHVRPPHRLGPRASLARAHGPCPAWRPPATSTSSSLPMLSPSAAAALRRARACPMGCASRSSSTPTPSSSRSTPSSSRPRSAREARSRRSVRGRAPAWLSSRTA